MAVELRGILGGPGCGFISTCLLQQHRVPTLFLGASVPTGFKSKQWEITCKDVSGCIPREGVHGWHGGE